MERVRLTMTAERNAAEQIKRAIVDRREDKRVRVGLCADCVFGQRIESARGSVFYRCERSATDPTFPKYPQLPVRQCVGYVPRPLEAE